MHRTGVIVTLTAPTGRMARARPSRSHCGPRWHCRIHL